VPPAAERLIVRDVAEIVNRATTEVRFPTSADVGTSLSAFGWREVASERGMWSKASAAL
jgi:hypothetical protein